MKKICINCNDVYEESKGKNLTGYCWYCREVRFGKPDDTWLPQINIKELNEFLSKGCHIIEAIKLCSINDSTEKEESQE